MIVATRRLHSAVADAWKYTVTETSVKTWPSINCYLTGACVLFHRRCTAVVISYQAVRRSRQVCCPGFTGSVASGCPIRKATTSGNQVNAIFNWMFSCQTTPRQTQRLSRVTWPTRPAVIRCVCIGMRNVSGKIFLITLVDWDQEKTPKRHL